MFKFIYKITMGFILACGILYIKDSGWIDTNWIAKQVNAEGIYEYFNAKLNPKPNISSGISTTIPNTDE